MSGESEIKPCMDLHIVEKVAERDHLSSLTQRNKTTGLRAADLADLWTAECCVELGQAGIQT